ncbi:hypothetical protein [Ferribacterium limneticum]|uniref:hypothetical protein n=1 Tax=Ferribacterium limneticum TaxID=76259 RepID=UPI001CFAE2E1|nr:hypothetical protein [Ferribacterium limneticum]UCV28976.1 hypothetical protein KI617_02405 [Ferribacterium limneticum]UCV32894.1 hypothetical protein KI608_02405 [Ferribacterium limneticum]
MEETVLQQLATDGEFKDGPDGNDKLDAENTHSDSEYDNEAPAQGDTTAAD